MMPITPVVKQLLILNVLFYIGAQLVAPAYPLLSLYYFQNDLFHFWQPLTHMFMHAPFPRIEHIVFNMLGLYMFGSTLEHFWGAKRFLAFYITCGLGAALVNMGVTYLEVHHFLSQVTDVGLSTEDVHRILNLQFEDGDVFSKELFLKGLQPILLQNGQMASLSQSSFDALYQAACQSQISVVGASGAIYGLLVAYAFMFPNSEMMMIFLPIPIKAKYFVPGIILFDFVGGISSSSIIGGPSTGVAHFAHIGGALFGFLMMWNWRNRKFTHNRWN
ncbi:rhomboid family intramembrane serine protease [Flavobacterium sp.]|uniref:rhomboid family intramembrane serine protease n=1 Tax=Flavobacterium sp. TaxID=239 RepID=UPI00120E0A40|nr:rhomboid family intramembrane serine protease [Flavobacterium sp.]RZJ69555.1 MAG: rhomboid family intramembrane serine protease [Flavobacterium sp.]